MANRLRQMPPVVVVCRIGNVETVSLMTPGAARDLEESQLWGPLEVTIYALGDSLSLVREPQASYELEESSPF